VLTSLILFFQFIDLRARVERAARSAMVGLAPREARVVILLLGLGGWAVMGSTAPFVAAVVVVAILATLTLIRRVTVVVRALGARERT
ncbi:MAG: hypothetical protein ACR2G8_06215, partial [Candidatus Limnocylindria bacterium]